MHLLHLLSPPSSTRSKRRRAPSPSLLLLEACACALVWLLCSARLPMTAAVYVSGSGYFLDASIDALSIHVGGVDVGSTLARMNTQLEQMSARIDTMQGQIDGLTQTNAELWTDLTAAREQVAQLESLNVTLGSSPLVSAVLSGAATLTALQGSNATIYGSLSALQTADTLLAMRDDSLTSSLAAFTGVIVMWSGLQSNIPSQWLLCDGTNGTPDLRDRFIVGAGSVHASGSTGGASSATPIISVAGTALSVAQMPAHNHGGSTGFVVDVGAANAARDFSNALNNGSPKHFQTAGDMTYGTNFFNDHKHSIPSQGSGATHTHSATSSAVPTKPPYYALAFIMRVTV